MSHLLGPKYGSAHAAINKIGAKAFNLVKMREAGLNVPAFFCLSADGVSAILAPLHDQIKAYESALTQESEEVLAPAAAELQQAIQSLQLSPKLSQEIEQKLKDCFGEKSGLAIRSSGSMEDLAQASFAGQYDSFLYVQAQAREQAILKCIASAYSYGIGRYRQKMGLAREPFSFAVIFQEMVPAYKSGVAFSADQTANLADALIVAGYGLGEGVVSNAVETDTFCFDRQKESYRAIIEKKRHYLDYNSKTGAIEKWELDSAKEGSPVLSREEVNLIFKELLKAEELLKAPADIEFAFDANGQLSLLQMRPISGLDPSKVQILDNTNIVESYPGISSPLTFSLARLAYQQVFSSCAKDFWIPRAKTKQLEPVFQKLIAHYKGRIYYRLDNWYELIDLVFKSKKSRQAWQNAVGLKDAQNRGLADLWSMAKMASASAWMLLRHPARVRFFFRRFKKIEADLQALCEADLDRKQIWDAHQEAIKSLFSIWSITIVNDFLAFKFFGFLQARLRSLGFEDAEALAHELSSRFESIESEQAVLHLLEIKDSILTDPHLQRVFEREPKAIPEGLINYPSLQAKIEFHRQHYGDRVLAELKLEVPSLQQDPLAVYQLIKSQLNSSMTKAAHLERKVQLRHKAQKRIRERLSPISPSFWLIKVLAIWAGNGLKNRENMRFARARAYGRVKQVFMRVAAMMEAEGYLSQAQDVFYLDLADLGHFCVGKPDKAWQEKVQDRKQEFEEFESLDLPDRISYLAGEEPRFRTTATTEDNGEGLNGLGVSKGKVKAEVVVVHEPSFELNIKGKILVSKMTDPAWVFLMTQAVGIISEKGSVLSHTAIVGRELGIPALVGVSNATKILKNGQTVVLDADAGRVIF